MLALLALFSRPRLRSFVLLDRHGICRALRQSRHSPAHGDWVEVAHYLPSWLNRTLPAGARVDQPGHPGKRQVTAPA